MTLETTTNSFHPVPLFVTTRDAVRLFSIGRTRLYELRRDNEDFRALTIKTGRDVLFDTMRCYQWFKDHCGGELE